MSVLNAKCGSFRDGPMKSLPDTLELLAKCVYTERFEVEREQNIFYEDIVGREKYQRDSHSDVGDVEKMINREGGRE